MSRSVAVRLLTVAALLMGPVLVAADASAAAPDPRTHARKVPSRAQWLADVKAAMAGAKDYVRERVASGDEGLVINFDIDNTVIATYYDGGGAIPLMARFSRFLTRQGVGMVFNTGRSADQRTRTLNQLTRVGYPVTSLCLRNKGEALASGKQRCRDQFADEGYTLIANIGNNPTDFEGDGYEKAFVLPNYNGVLG